MPNIAQLGAYGDPSGSGLMFRNRIINGDMRIDQRNNGAKYTPTTATYSTGLDLWQIYIQTSSVCSITKTALSSSDLPFASGLKFYTRFNRESATGVGNELLFLSHAIEGFNIADLNFGTSSAKPITLSFWARASGSYNFSVAFLNAKSGATRSYTSPFNVTTSWQRYTYTLTADTTGTWGTDTSLGLNIRFGFGGTAVTSVQNQWTSDNLYLISGQTQFQSLALNSYVDICGVQLEAGTQATPFEQRPIGTELALCQRYYVNANTSRLGAPGAQSPSVWGLANNTGTIATNIIFPVYMRAAPSMTIFSYNSTANRVSQLQGAADVGSNVINASVQTSAAQCILLTDSSNPFTAGLNYWFWYTANAEL